MRKKIIWFIGGSLFSPILVAMYWVGFKLILPVNVLLQDYVFFAFVMLSLYSVCFVLPLVLGITRWKKNKAFAIGSLTGVVLVILAMFLLSFVMRRTPEQVRTPRGVTEYSRRINEAKRSPEYVEGGAV